MTDASLRQDVDGAEPRSVEFEEYASYEDGEDLVICDRSNPKAWLRSDTTVDLDA